MLGLSDRNLKVAITKTLKQIKILLDEKIENLSKENIKKELNGSHWLE